MSEKEEPKKTEVNIEPYWNMYNKYNLLNESGMDVSDACNTAIRELMNEFVQFNPRDLLVMITDAAHRQTLDRIAKRSISIKRSEKINK